MCLSAVNILFDTLFCHFFCSLFSHCLTLLYYFFLFATVRLGPFLVLALVFVF